MQQEQLRSIHCSNPTILKEVVREESPDGSPLAVVALNLRCEYAERKICPLANRLVGRDATEAAATAKAMAGVDREIPIGCLARKEPYAAS